MHACMWYDVWYDVWHDVCGMAVWYDVWYATREKTVGSRERLTRQLRSSSDRCDG